jgi:uncharacterized protein YbjQ (UPF0145 family)
MKTKLVCLCAVAALSGCASWSTASVDRSDQQKTQQSYATIPEHVKIVQGDIADRRYVSLGDITATVNKTTIFNANPTKEMVNAKLREQAAQLGADAVIFVRYGDGGISLMSWGSLEGKGRAIKYQ